MPDQELTTLADPLRSEYEINMLRRWWDTQNVLTDVAREREVQFEQWGDQDLPLGASRVKFKGLEDHTRAACQKAHAEGTLDYSLILLEEVYEALAEEDPAKMYDELIDTAAVAVKMAELIKRKLTPTPEPVQG